MPNTPSQFPNIDLPGAEYFSIAPNGSIALQGMRRVNFSSPNIPIAGGQKGGQVIATTQIESNFVAGAGIWVRLFTGIVQPQDTTGALQISGLRTGFALSGPNVAYDIGFPLITLTQPTGPIPAMIVQDVLVTQRDIAAFDSPISTNLNATFVAIVNNTDATNPHNLISTLKIVYSRLDGFTE